MMVGVAGALRWERAPTRGQLRGGGPRYRGPAAAVPREAEATEESADTPLASGVRVGVSYVIGAVVPILPVLFGARTLLPSLVVAGGVIVLVSAILAFLSGMNVKRRILLNLGIMAAAVAIATSSGWWPSRSWGITV